MSINSTVPSEEIDRRYYACKKRDDTNELTHSLERKNDNKACDVRNKRDDLCIEALERQNDTDYYNELLKDGF